MATTTATIAINSSDIMSGQVVSLTNSFNLKQAGSKTGIEETTGLGMKVIQTVSSVLVIDDSDDAFGTAGSNYAAKLYMKNTSTSTSQYLTVSVDGDVLGRLYGGDFLFIPYKEGTDGDSPFNHGSGDVSVAASTSEKLVLEYMVFAG